MLHHNGLAVSVYPAGQDNRSCGGGFNRSAFGRRNVDTGMVPVSAMDRMFPVAKCGSPAAMNGKDQ